MRRYRKLPTIVGVTGVLCGLLISCGTGNLFDFGQKDSQSSETGKVVSSGSGFAGVYEVEGSDYTADLTISKTGACYYVKWVMSDGTAYYGKGIEIKGILGVVYDMGDGTNSGVVAYKKDGQGLTGLWTAASGEEAFYEKTKQARKLRVSGQDISGEYSITGSNASGGRYDGNLYIIKSGETWALQWSSGGEIYGKGLVVDDVLVAGYGNQEGIGIAVYEVGTNELRGSWLFVSYGELSSSKPVSLGSEIAKSKRS